MGTPELCFTIKFLSCTNTLGAETYAMFEVSCFLRDRDLELQDTLRPVAPQNCLVTQ